MPTSSSVIWPSGQYRALWKAGDFKRHLSTSWGGKDMEAELCRVEGGGEGEIEGDSVPGQGSAGQ